MSDLHVSGNLTAKIKRKRNCYFMIFQTNNKK